MPTPVQLSLPLSATALRLGAAFLTQLADQTETIYGELTGLNPFTSRNVEVTVDNVGPVAAYGVDGVTVVETKDPNYEGDVSKVHHTGHVDHTPDSRVVETPEEKQFRLHGNVASAGGDDAAKVFGGNAPKPDAAPVAPQAPSATAPVAPTALAPTAPAAPNPSSVVATDKGGLPHDKRIHSTPPSINKGDGLWRAKRGRDEIEAKRIEAELLQLMAVPAPTAPVADAPKPDLDPSATAAPAPVAPQAPTAPVAPTASAPASTTPKNLGELMTWAQGQVAAGNIASLDAVRAAAVEAGVAALPLLGTRPDLVPVVYAALGGV